MNGGGIAHGNRLGLFCNLAAVTAIVLVAGCKPPPDARWPVDPAAAERGRMAIERVQCAACHDIPGIDWPKGRTGPSLSGFGGRGMIAGALPNRPDVLAAFVRDAPSVKPGSPMPPMPIVEGESRDIAAYFYGASQ